MTEMTQKAKDAYARAEKLTARMTTDQLRMNLDPISASTDEGVLMREWIIEELAFRCEKWAQAAPTELVLAELAKVPYTCTADEIIADAYALALIVRHREAAEADEDWYNNPSDAPQSRGSSPYILKVMTQAGYAS